MRSIAICLTICIVAVGYTYSQDSSNTIAKWRVAGSAIASSNFGKTEYIFEQSAYVVKLNGDTAFATIKSQLEFPMDVIMYGGMFRVERSHSDSVDMIFQISFLTNASDPRSTMLDRDWEDQFEFSHTYSMVRLWSFLIDLEFQKRMSGNRKSGLFLYTGFRMQRISQDLVSLTGWQFSPSRVDFSFTGPVGIYEITYAIPQIGLAPRFEREKTVIESKIALGIPFVSDQDYHILRNFTTEASGIGVGLLTKVELKHHFTGSRNRGGLFFGFSGEFSYMRASISKDWTYYGDDPATTIDDTGNSIKGLPHLIRSMQGNLSFLFGFSF